MIAYHYCVMRQNSAGLLYSHGVVQASAPVESFQEYERMLAQLAAKVNPPCSPSDLVVLSLTPLNPKG